jgi:hypothetical protein
LGNVKPNHFERTRLRCRSLAHTARAHSRKVRPALKADSLSAGSPPLPCTRATRTYHEVMESPTFEALQRIMDAMRPRVGNDKQASDDWLRVTAWMDEVATEIDDLETLGTDDPRRTLREVR